ncbi:MAG: helix-turn-helix transcriptional regulator [Agriterribacter sp.]
MIRVYLYKNLFFLRKKNGWTQAEMQDRCGISNATWSNYENGKTEPDIQSILNISRAFKVSVDDLLTVDFASVQPIEENEHKKNTKNVQVNVQPNVQVKGKNEGYYSYPENAETMINEPSEVGAWAILGQLKQMDAKLDQLRVLAEKAAENKP